MVTDPALLACLRRNWGLDGARVTVHNGGMGSQTWFVELGDRRWVAKAVAPDGGVQFAGGMAIAQRLEQEGIPAGAPVPAAGGQLVVNVGNDWLALLTWVPGRALTGQDPADQSLIGTTLARVHRALTGCQVEQASRFHWVDPDAAYLALRHWLRPAITAALHDLDGARPDSMSWGLLHDLASAVMYVGGPDCAQELIGAYLDESTLEPDEVQRGLSPMLRFRWAVQADYFAGRIAENNLTGISGPEENEKGLADARRSLTS